MSSIQNTCNFEIYLYAKENSLHLIKQRDSIVILIKACLNAYLLLYNFDIMHAIKCVLPETGIPFPCYQDGTDCAV